LGGRGGDFCGAGDDGKGTANGDLQAGQVTRFPPSPSGALSFFAHFGHSMTDLPVEVAADVDAGGVGCVGFALTDFKSGVAALDWASGGITNGALQAGHWTRFPASSAGALSFFAHFGHVTTCDIDPAPTAEEYEYPPRSRVTTAVECRNKICGRRMVAATPRIGSYR